mmetsp:Transcript_30002/g.67280  ORF Transcript_30002/g.67280 Transcript_30002/m.67280 type:complete len:221 (+) Transcript_30002:107-769(+)
MSQNFHGSIYHVGLVVFHTPFFAERIHQLVDLRSIVSRNHGEKVVFHLVLKTPTKPVNKELWYSVTTNDVSGGCYLKIPEVRPGFSIIDRHAIVAKAKDSSKEETTGACRGEKIHHRVRNRPLSKSSGQNGHPSVVKCDADFLEQGVLKALALHLSFRIRGRRPNTIRSLEAFVEPGDPCKQQYGEVGKGLEPDCSPYEGSVLAIVGGAETLGLLQRPGK